MMIQIQQPSEFIEVEGDDSIQKRFFILFTLCIIITIILVVVFIVG